MNSDNPLLQTFDLPPYSAIRIEHLQPAIATIIADNEIALAQIIGNQSNNPTWNGLVLAEDELDHFSTLFQGRGMDRGFWRLFRHGSRLPGPNAAKPASV
jgi:Zn-dependent oligopeptidase